MKSIVKLALICLVFVSVSGRATYSLHEAVEGGYLEEVTRLIKNGANINAKNKRDETPLDTAIDTYIKVKDGDLPDPLLCESSFNVVKCLIAYGALYDQWGPYKGVLSEVPSVFKKLGAFSRDPSVYMKKLETHFGTKGLEKQRRLLDELLKVAQKVGNERAKDLLIINIGKLPKNLK